MAPRVSSGRGAGPHPAQGAEAARRPATGQNRHWADEDEDEGAYWLEEEEEAPQGPSHTLIGRKALIILISVLLLLILIVVGGILLVSKQEDQPIDIPSVGEEVPVLKSPGPWKVLPSGPGIEGVPVEGQGQILFGTGDGLETEARIAVEALPEDVMEHPSDLLAAQEEALRLAEAEARLAEQAAAEAAAKAAARAAASKPVPVQKPVEVQPVVPAPAPKPAPVKPKTADVVVPKEAPAPAPAKPKAKPEAEPVAKAAPKPAETGGGGGQVLQLGAFSSEARARTAFKDLSARYRYLNGMEPQIIPVVTDGKTLYRLRTSAGSSSSAQDVCGRLKVAGEACSVVR